MNVSLSSVCVTTPRPVISVGGTASTALVGYTTDGSYPAGTTTGDVVIASISTAGLLIPPSGWTQIATGSIGMWGTYYAFQRTATGPLSGAVFSQEGQVVMTLRGVSAANLISAFNAGSTWSSLTGLVNNSNIYAVGFTDDGSGAHGGATLSASFTTQTNASRQVLATKTTLNSGTTFSYTGCANNGVTAMCFSYGIA